MAVRMSDDPKYQDLRDQMAEAVRVVAQWPQWMIDRSQRQKQWDDDQGKPSNERT